MENPIFSELPEEVRAKLKRSYAHPDYCQGGWSWWPGDPAEEWDYNKWALALYSDKDADWGHVHLVPLTPEGVPLGSNILPLPAHKGWALKFDYCDTWFVVEGTVEEAKALLDPLLACPSPEIPCEPPSEGEKSANGGTRGSPRP